MGYIGEKARGERLPAKELLLDKFGDTIVAGGVSAQYVRFGKSPVVIGVSGLKFDSMAVSILASDDVIFEQFTGLINEGYSILIVRNEDDFRAFTEKDGNLAEARFSVAVLDRCAELIKSTDVWGGKLATNGELTFDPSTPSPGPHYYTNMLIGNRIGFDEISAHMDHLKIFVPLPHVAPGIPAHWKASYAAATASYPLHQIGDIDVTGDSEVKEWFVYGSGARCQ